jgi:hypothetical protein
MPHLQFEFNRPLSGETREGLADWATQTYADVMETGTGHVAVSIAEHPPYGLSLGRADAGEPIAILNADVRDGRTFGQRERFATAVIDRFTSEFEIPRDHCYVVYTEHPGHDFILDEGALESWGDDGAETGSVDWRVAEDDTGALE